MTEPGIPARFLPAYQSIQQLQQFVTTVDVHAKFGYWSAIIDFILQPLGGRQPISENNCDCAVCQHDLAMICAKG